VQPTLEVSSAAAIVVSCGK